jgi:hypothetical protein
MEASFGTVFAREAPNRSDSTPFEGGANLQNPCGPEAVSGIRNQEGVGQLDPVTAQLTIQARVDRAME